MMETQVIAFLLVLTRVSVFVGFFSLFAFRQLPVLIKIGVATSLSVFWYGEFIAGNQNLNGHDIGILDGTILFAREFIIGMMLSVVLNLFLMPCKVAGAYIGQEMGLSLASISSPGTPDSGTLVTRVFEAFTIIVFFALNLHHFLMLAIDFSFRYLAGKSDILQMSDGINVLQLPTEDLCQLLNDTNDYGLMIVAPVAILLAIVTVALAILNRVAPTMNLFSIGLGVRTGFGIFCLAMMVPVIFGSIQGYLSRVQLDIEHLFSLFRFG